MTKYSNFSYEKHLGSIVNGIKIESFNSFKRNQSQVNCQCHCGQKFVTYTRHVLSGNTKSCGCSRDRYKKHEEIIGAVFTKLLSVARARNLEVAPDVDLPYLYDLFINQNRKCALSNKELTLPKVGKDFSANASIDRIDSSKGYIRGNIQWVDKKINFMKQEYSQHEFIELCKAVANHNQESTCQTNFQEV